MHPCAPSPSATRWRSQQVDWQVIRRRQTATTHKDERKQLWLGALEGRDREGAPESEIPDIAYWDFIDAWGQLLDAHERCGDLLFEFERYLFALLGLGSSSGEWEETWTRAS